MSTPIIEICVDSLDALLAAYKGGANRVELCSALSEGGLTPSIGFIRAARRLCPDLAIHVMIRPRMGDFLYSPEEKDLMLEDIKAISRLGVQGIVLGALTAEGMLDTPFIRSAKSIIPEGISITFHRAFDVCRDRIATLEALCQLGVERILTSGGSPTAIEGASELAALISRYGKRIIIMPGSGISPLNILALWQQTGASEFHLSAKHRVNSKMLYHNTAVSMGGGNDNEYIRYSASEAIVREVVSLLSDTSLSR